MIVAAVLAAGGSRRLGYPKQLVEYQGHPLIIRAVETASLVRCAVVLGAHADETTSVMTDLGCSVTYLRNIAWADGMASSIHVATRWADVEGAEALILHLVDQPLVDRGHLERLIAEYRAGAPLVGSSYAGVVGAPAIFRKVGLPEVARIAGRSRRSADLTIAPGDAIDRRSRRCRRRRYARGRSAARSGGRVQAVSDVPIEADVIEA